MKNVFPVSETDTLFNGVVKSKSVSIVYFILVHRLPKQFKRLFEAIYEPGNSYLIHIDKKASNELKAEICLFLKPYKNAYNNAKRKSCVGRL